MPEVRRTRTKPEIPARVSGVWSWAQEFLSIKFEKAALTDRETTLKKKLMEAVEEQGEPDEKGNQFLELPQPITVHGQTFRQLKRERRASLVFLQEDAEQLLKEKGLLDRVLRPVTVMEFDQDELYVLHQEGLISEKEIDAMFTENVTYAFKPLA